MSKRFIRWLSFAGAALSAPLGPPAEYVRPRRGDNAQDFAKLVGDMRRVGSDLRQTALKELPQRGK